MKIKHIALATAISLLSLSAQAALVATDWKTEGDALATLDTSTGIEWLDLTETDGMSVNEVEGLLGTTYAGWRFPTRIEVNDLIVSTFPSHAAAVEAGGGGGTYDPGTYNEASDFRSLFGTTHEDTNSVYSMAFFKLSPGTDYSVSYSGVAQRKSGDYVIIYNENGVFSKTIKSASYGVFLVSDGGTTRSSQQDPSINTPAGSVSNVSMAFCGVALSSMGLMLLGGIRRRKQ